MTIFSKYLNRRSDPHAQKQTLQVLFTIVLVVPFVVQLTLVVGLTGWLSVRSGKQSVRQVAIQLRQEASARIEDRLDSYLAIPHTLNQLNAEAARLGQLDFRNPQSLQLRWWRQIRLYDTLSNIGFGSIQGEFTAGDRRNRTFRLGGNLSPDRTLRMYETDEFGNPQPIPAYVGTRYYDPRSRPWYRIGQASPNGQWTAIFSYASQQDIYVISAVRPLFDRAGNFQGVLATDLILTEINRFLQTLEIVRSGEVYIMERSGLLVATSTPNPPLKIVQGQVQRLHATESSSPLIRASALFVRQRYTDFAQINAPVQLNFSLQGKRQYLDIIPYQDEYGLDWLVAIVQPEAALLQGLQSTALNTILLGAIALIATLSFGLLSARWLIQPILRLSAAATALAEGDWDITVPIEREDELGVLAAAFNRMAGQLQESYAALKERETKLAEAQRIAHLGNWELDLSTHRMSGSDELFRIYGLQPDSELPSYPAILEYMPPEDAAQIRQAVQRALEAGEPYEVDHCIVRPNGEIRYVHSKGQPKFDTQGRVIRLFGTVIDMTERQQTEREREELLKREQAARSAAEAANRIKDEFLAVLSHELRTPLNPIVGWVRLLRTRKFNEAKIAQALETIERNALLQTQLIEDLLDVSRILRGKLVLKPSLIQIGGAIRSAIETVQLSAETKSIAIETHLDETVGPIYGDANRLQQVVWNLLSNAVKFTPAGGKIEVRLFRPEGNPDLAVIQVSDTGKGIKPDFLPYVFESFRQADSSTTRTFGGLGLGLAIVRYLVEMHGGAVSAMSSGEDCGSTFTIELPICRKQTLSQFAASPIEMSLQRVPEAFPQLTERRILIVDDDSDACQLIAFVLAEAGAIVESANSAEEALSKIALHVPDILVSDIGMPDMDGCELIAKIRQFPSERGGNLKAIALTAYASDPDVQRVLQAGFNRHLSKPVDLVELIDAIGKL